MLIFSQIDCHF